MDNPMFLHPDLTPEPLPTQIAMNSALVLVEFAMAGEGGPEAESLPTRITDVRPGSCVDVFVFFKLHLTGVGMVTDIADKILWN